MATMIETHKNLALGQIHKAFRRFGPMSKGVPQVRIHVICGLHSDSFVDFETSEFTIGSEPSHDVMLLDDSFAGSVIQIRLETSILGPVAVAKALSGQITLGGTAINTADWSPPERLPCDIKCAGVVLRLEQKGSPFPPLMDRLKSAALPLLLSTALIAFSVQFWLLVRPQAKLELHKTEMQTMQSPEQIASTSAEMHDTLLEAGLNDQLAISEDSTGAFIISGSLPPTMMDNWYMVRSEIDKVSANATVIAKVEETVQLTDMPAIAAVQSGAEPTIVFADGRTASPGDILKDGWIIEAINTNEIILVRADETTIITY